MNCLPATGVNAWVMIIIATVTILFGIAGLYWLSRNKHGFKYTFILLLMLSSAVFITLPVHSTSAAGDVSDCPTDVSAVSHHKQNNHANTPNLPQKDWKIPFNNASEWNQFTHYNVSLDGALSDQTYTFSAASGTGTITAHRPDGFKGNHNRRDFFMFNPAGDVKDGEVRALVAMDYATSPPGLVQLGFVMRGSNLGSGEHQVGIVAWTNVILYGGGVTIGGVWRGNEAAAGTNNGSPHLIYGSEPNSKAVSAPITSIVANGSQATVTLANDINAADFPAPPYFYVSIENVDSSINGNQSVTSMPNAHTLVFNTSATGSWTGGTAEFKFNFKRWIAARVIGNVLTIKQWLPSQSEPAWNDPNNIVQTFPATLDNGDPLPSKGEFGLLFAHGGDGMNAHFSHLEFKSLD